MKNTKENILRLVQMGLLSGLIILLQTVFVIPLPGSLTLTLTMVPIVVGAVLYGAKAGAFLGGVFGVLVSVMAVQGQLGLLTNMMVAQGYRRRLVGRTGERCVQKTSADRHLYRRGGCAAGQYRYFCGRMLTVFRGVMLDFADGIGMGGVGALYFAIVVLVGINFVIEFGANLLLSPAISSIVKAVRKIGK